MACLNNLAVIHKGRSSLFTMVQLVKHDGLETRIAELGGQPYQEYKSNTLPKSSTPVRYIQATSGASFEPQYFVPKCFFNDWAVEVRLIIDEKVMKQTYLSRAQPGAVQPDYRGIIDGSVRNVNGADQESSFRFSQLLTGRLAKQSPSQR
jgi:hypothetical protein